MATDSKIPTIERVAVNSSVPSSDANSISKSVDHSMAEHNESYIPDPEKDSSVDPELVEREIAVTKAENDVPNITSEEEEEEEYPKSWRLGLITAALCLSVFCMALGK
jgi:hypothetical protein